MSDNLTTKKTFIDELRVRCSVFHAAKAAQISRDTVYRWRKEDLQFAADWNDAIEDAVDVIEESMYQRALAGDTTLTIFFMKGNRARYRDKLILDVNKLDADIERELALIAARGEGAALGEAESESVN